MVEATPTSVILPTMGWNEVCEQLMGQLRPDDELLIVCDRKQESVVDRVDAAPDAVRLVVASEPERCSGKANAIAAGMEAASHDRIVWTDDDFYHPPNWLERLRTDYERHGPTSEVPVFLGQDILSKLLEPAYLVSATLTVSRGDIPWAGALIFDRDDIDERAFLADLRRTVSDDGLLMEHTAVTTVDRVRQVSIGGSVRETLENQARFTKIIWYHNRGGTIAQVIGAAAVTVACLLAPLPAFALVTLAMAGLYAVYSVDRPTFLVAYPLALVSIPLFVYGMARRTFVWGGRRYRWQRKFDVRVESV